MDKDTIAISIKLDKAFHKKVKLYSVEKGVTIKDLFIQCMERLIAEEESKKGK